VGLRGHAGMILGACLALAALGTSCGGGSSSTPQVTQVTSVSVTLSSASVSFGSQPVGTTSDAQPATVTNTGTGTLSITGFSFTGANASDFAEADTCGASIASGANCTITVMFTPSAAGTRAATLDISDNASGSPQSVSLTGEGAHDVVLTWTASPTPEVTYIVFRGTSPGGEGPTPVSCIFISGTSCADANVTSGITYYYVVAAVPGNGAAQAQSTFSNESSATAP